MILATSFASVVPRETAVCGVSRTKTAPPRCWQSTTTPLNTFRAEMRPGNIIMCEKALIKIARGSGKAYTPDGKETIKKYSGDGGKNHRQNFIDAVRANDHGKLNAPVEGCHVSSGICHLSTISYKAGKTSSPDQIRARMQDYEDIRQTTDEQLKHISGLDIDKSKLILGPKLTFDPKAERFVGNDAKAGNKLLRYEMRKEFAVPDRV